MLGRAARRRPEPHAGARVHPVVQRQLQDLGEVEVAGEDVRFLAEGADLHAAGAAAGPGVLQRLPLAELLLDHRVGVEQRREAVPLADDPQRVLEDRAGRLARELEVRGRLQQVHLVDDLEQQVGDLVGAVGAVGEQAAEVDVGEVGVSAALLGRDADLGRRRVVVELDEEALEQLARRGLGQRAVGEPLPVERQQVLVEVPGVERVPAVQLGDHAEVAEPVRLQRLVEVARRVRRDAAAHGGDALELGPPFGVGGGRGQRLGQGGVPLGEHDDRVAGDVHRDELLAPVVRLDVAGEVERGQGACDVGLEVEHPLAVDLVVEDGVPGGALLHELGEDPGVVGGPPLLGQHREHPVAQRAPPPVRDHGPSRTARRTRPARGTRSSGASRGWRGPRGCGR